MLASLPQQDPVGVDPEEPPSASPPLQPAEPAPALSESRLDQLAGPGWRTQLADEGAWKDTGMTGIRAKLLRHDPERRSVTMLVTMDAGVSYPRHRHAGSEECFVLQGDLQVGGRTLGPGDYQCAEAGSTHETQTTRDGCTILLVASQDDLSF